MEFIDYISKKESVEISKEKGRFKNFEGSLYDGDNYLYNKYQGKSAGKISDNEWFELDKQISKYGIKMFLSDDSHKIEHLGRHFDEAELLAKNCGAGKNLIADYREIIKKSHAPFLDLNKLQERTL